MTIPSSRSLIFEVKSTGSKLAFIHVLRLGLGNARAVSAYVTDGRLWKTSDFFRNIQKLLCRFQKSQHSQDKNLTPIFQKKMAGIYTTMSIGIFMGRVWFCLIEVQGDSATRNKKEGICVFVLFPFTTLKHLVRFNQATVKTTITHNNFRHCCIRHQSIPAVPIPPPG